MTDTVRRRPGDRKDQIVARAAELFVDRGFHAVTMEELAGAAGVTARALYRHYTNKQALLTAVIVDSQERYLGAVPAAAGHAGSLTEDLPGFVDAARATRELTILWQREARYLDEPDRRRVRRRLNTIVDGIERGLRSDRPDLTPEQLALRAWAVSSTLTSLGFHDLNLPGPALPVLLNDVCLAAARTPVTEPASTRPPPSEAIAPPTRREALLAAGAALFRGRGYPAVGITDIGRAAGIAGSGIYRTFGSKQAILDALVIRLEEWRSLEHRRALRGALPPVELLRRLVEGHTNVSLDDPDLVGVMLTELPHASRDVVAAVEDGQTTRRAEWTELARRITPTTGAAEARIRVRAATAYIEDVARTPRLVRHPGVGADLTEIALTILTSR